MKKRSTLKRMMYLILLAAVILFRPGAGLNVLAQEPQSTAGTAVQTDVSAQEAAAAAQAEADALMAAHLAAWQQAQQEYAAQLAAYQQALAQQQTEAAAQAAQLQEAAEVPSAVTPAAPLAGKTVSILGDSISTFQGWIPEGYACFYPDPGNDIKDVTQTWWMQVIQNTGMQLLANGSYSASTVCGDSSSEESSAGCSNRRIVDLMGNTGIAPDVILVYMGVNDFFHSIDLGSFSGTATYRNDHYIWDFTEGYELMLQKLQAVYPNARIYCMTLLETNSWEGTRVNANGNTVEDYNSRIRQVAAAHGISVIDLRNCGIESYELGRYTSDGVHLNREGAAKIAAYVTNVLLMGG